MGAINKSVADLRSMFQPKCEGGPVLVRPAMGFIEFEKDEISAVIDDVERLFVRTHLGDEPTALELFALRVLIESYF